MFSSPSCRKVGPGASFRLYVPWEYSSLSFIREENCSSCICSRKKALFWLARVCWPILCLCRPFCIFERCLDWTQSCVASRCATNLAIISEKRHCVFSREDYFLYKKLKYTQKEQKLLKRVISNRDSWEWCKEVRCGMGIEHFFIPLLGIGIEADAAGISTTASISSVR
jgi:hypothetical protein